MCLPTSSHCILPADVKENHLSVAALIAFGAVLTLHPTSRQCQWGCASVSSADVPQYLNHLRPLSVSSQQLTSSDSAVCRHIPFVTKEIRPFHSYRMYYALPLLLDERPSASSFFRGGVLCHSTAQTYIYILHPCIYVIDLVLILLTFVFHWRLLFHSSLLLHRV